MDSFWANLLGDADSWARPVVGIAMFTFALYLIARPRKSQHLSAEELRQQAKFKWVLIGMVLIFGIFTYLFTFIGGTR